MNADSLLALLLFIAPGFASFEVANFFSWRRAARYTEREKLSATLLMGVASFYLASLVQYKSFGLMWIELQNPKDLDSSVVVWIFLSSVIVGLLWVLVREGIPLLRAAINKIGMARQQPVFLGAHSVWSLFCERLQGDVWLRILTKDNRVYFGHAEIIPTVHDDCDLLLDNVSVAYLEDGKAVLQSDAYEELGNLLYIRGDEIRTVLLMPGERPETSQLDCAVLGSASEVKAGDLGVVNLSTSLDEPKSTQASSLT